MTAVIVWLFQADTVLSHNKIGQCYKLTQKEPTGMSFGKKRKHFFI